MGARHLRPLLVLIASVAPGALALASGTGAGGGGSVPSFSHTQYGLVQEYQLGVADYQAEKFKSAAHHFENAVHAQPRDANTWFMLGAAKSFAGDLKGAAKALAKAARIDPTPIATHRDLAITEARLKENDRAAAELTMLNSRAMSCNNTCPESADLKAAIAAVQQALGVVSPSAAALPLHGDFKFAMLGAGDMA